MNAQQPVREWFYDRGGVAEGPFDLATLRGMIGTQLPANTMVWKDGQAEWLPANQVEALRIPDPIVVPPAIRVPPPPPAPVHTAPVAQGRPLQGGYAQSGYAPIQTVSAPGRLMEPVSIGELVLLSIVTFGIYGIVKFYQAGMSYSALVGRPTKFANLFWWYLGLSIASVVLSVAGVGVLTMIAAFIIGALLLAETINLRDELVARHGGTPAQLMSKNAHVGLWVAGSVLSMIFIGVFALLFQGIKFFDEYATTLQLARRNTRG